LSDQAPMPVHAGQGQHSGRLIASDAVLR